MVRQQNALFLRNACICQSKCVYLHNKTSESVMFSIVMIIISALTMLYSIVRCIKSKNGIDRMRCGLMIYVCVLVILVMLWCMN